MQEYEDAQAAMEEIEDQAEQDDADAEAAGARHANALAAMEECLGQRTECSVAYAAAKAVSQEKRSQIIRELLENHKPTSPESPSSERASLAMDDDDNEKPASSSKEGRYEALQSAHVDLVIRVPASMQKMGIVVNDDGVIESAPANLFDPDYRVLGLDGKQYYPGLEAVRI